MLNTQPMSLGVLISIEMCIDKVDMSTPED